ncbi:MAG TPA: arsenical pump-driving ATPase [Porphyromonadaceae bacterium]|jgi:arsenite-transporting ATPase|nr:arsenical pump-driving ATPase [Porphyromonadaceae bacterium]HBX19287.1 arsenical pump-driving ATPase [Porphyromonadaceae bacterium]
MKREQLVEYNPKNIGLTKYMFFTGKGGVGKTSLACSTAVSLADQGKRILLVSTDPASNLQDVFETTLDNKGKQVASVPNLTIINLNPEDAAKDYKESILAPYRGTMPDAMIDSIEEQLSGSCTVEIAAFNEFSEIITSKEKSNQYDYFIFDTAPTGHTLRMLELPQAWNNYLNNENPSANYVGQLSGMREKQEMYKEAVEKLSDAEQTTLILVSRPDKTALLEISRSSSELWDMNLKNQWVVVNGLLDKPNSDDSVADRLAAKQEDALDNTPENLLRFKTLFVPLRSYNLTGVENLRQFFDKDVIPDMSDLASDDDYKSLNELITHLHDTNKRVVFTMGKGGVGKTTMAAAIALGLADKGQKVHLTTTDPADHLKYVIKENSNISMSKIDPEAELNDYKAEVIQRAINEGKTKDELAYVKEDLEAPCNKEIAVFRKFAEIVKKADSEVVVIDTAPTGHTLLLLDTTQSYHKEVERTHGDIPESVKNLLPRLRDKNETEVIIVTLPEATPVLEAQRLKEDLERAKIENSWWIVNNSLVSTATQNSVLKARAISEKRWINEVDTISSGNMALVPWFNQDLQGDKLRALYRA